MTAIFYYIGVGVVMLPAVLLLAGGAGYGAHLFIKWADDVWLAVLILARYRKQDAATIRRIAARAIEEAERRDRAAAATEPTP